MNKPNKNTENTFRIGTSRPPTQLANCHYRTANLMLYRLYTTRRIACSRMSPAEAAYRNTQYELFGIRARWVGRNENRRRIPLSAPAGRPEGLRAHCSVQLRLEDHLPG